MSYTTVLRPPRNCALAIRQPQRTQEHIQPLLAFVLHFLGLVCIAVFLHFFIDALLFLFLRSPVQALCRPAPARDLISMPFTKKRSAFAIGFASRRRCSSTWSVREDTAHEYFSSVRRSRMFVSAICRNRAASGNGCAGDCPARAEAPPQKANASFKSAARCPWPDLPAEREVASREMHARSAWLIQKILPAQ